MKPSGNGHQFALTNTSIVLTLIFFFKVGDLIVSSSLAPFFAFFVSYNVSIYSSFGSVSIVSCSFFLSAVNYIFVEAATDFMDALKSSASHLKVADQKPSLGSTVLSLAQIPVPIILFEFGTEEFENLCIHFRLFFVCVVDNLGVFSFAAI